MANVVMGDVPNKKNTTIYTQMKENAQKYVDKIEEEYKQPDYEIKGQKLQEDNKYLYSIQTGTGVKICTIAISLITEKFKIHHTRRNTNSNTTQSYNGIYINYLSTNEGYRGQGHATKLLLYTVCLAFLEFEEKQLAFVKLEDATVGNQRRMKGHIYHMLGFIPIVLTELNMKRKYYMKGIDSVRVANMEHLLTAIVPMKLKEMKSVQPMNQQGGSSKRKTHKRKTKKNKRVL